MVRLLEKIQSFNLNVFHIPGVKNKIANYLSCYPQEHSDIESVEIPQPFLTHRSLWTLESNVEVEGPLLAEVACEGDKDEEYKSMVTHHLNYTPMRNIEADSELKKIQGM